MFVCLYRGLSRQVLSDADKRREYDTFGMNTGAAGGGGGQGFRQHPGGFSGGESLPQTQMSCFLFLTSHVYLFVYQFCFSIWFTYFILSCSVMPSPFFSVCSTFPFFPSFSLPLSFCSVLTCSVLYVLSCVSSSLLCSWVFLSSPQFLFDPYHSSPFSCFSFSSFLTYLSASIWFWFWPDHADGSYKSVWFVFSLCRFWKLPKHNGPWGII